MSTYDIIVIGGGAGGLAAAQAAAANKTSVLLIEKDARLGGILNQCIHNGFGLHHYREELTGPEYAEKAIDELTDKTLNIRLNTTVTKLNKEEDRFFVTYMNKEEGERTVTAGACVLTTGSYERTRGAIALPGTRPRGIMTAGSAQRYINIDGYMVGKRILILGSGDIGLIMARRLTLEGAEVVGVAELLPHASGLTRNIVQCLHDFDIPLYLSHTVTDIKGKETLESVTLSAIDAKGRPKKDSEKHFDVDTLLLSVGLIPDTKTFDGITFKEDPRTGGAYVDQHFETSVSGLFASGNALHIHDLVDFVTEESLIAGKAANRYVHRLKNKKKNHIRVNPGEGIDYVLPQRIDTTSKKHPVTFSFRVKEENAQATLRLCQGERVILEKKRRFLTPPEMERLILPVKKTLDVETPLTLHLEVDEG